MFHTPISGNQPTYELSINNFSGGVNLDQPQHIIKDNQFYRALNVYHTDQVLSKRPGQVSLYNFNESVKGIINYKNKVVIMAGASLYTWDGSTATEIYDTLLGTSCKFFIFNDTLYLLTGTNYYKYNGTTVSVVDGYIPVVQINRLPDGTDFDSNEQYNALTPKFRVLFNTVAAITVYKLPLPLANVAISVKFAGTVVPSTDYTFNNTTGDITFDVAFATSQNSLEVTATGTTSTRTDITSCIYADIYGGVGDIDGGTRIFVSDGTNKYHRSSLRNPEYYPEMDYDYVGDDAGITGFGRSYGKLIIFKTSSIYTIGYDYNNGNPLYPTALVNGKTGCTIPGSIQLINNDLVFGNNDGIYILLQTQNSDERNVQPVSRNINGNHISASGETKGLLYESNLNKAISIDYDSKYILALNGRVYIWDYGISPYYITSNPEDAQDRLSWWIWDNIQANVFYANDNLYYGSTQLIEMTPNIMRDFGNPINAYVETKAWDFKDASTLKVIHDVWLGIRTDTAVNMTLQFITDLDTYSNIYPIDTSYFNWINFAWDTFTLQVKRFKQSINIRPKLRRVTHLALQLVSSGVSNISLSSINIKYQPERRSK